MLAKSRQTAVVVAALRTAQKRTRRRALDILVGNHAATPCALAPSAEPARISCVVCAYNEAGRIRNILDAVHLHPALAEVIVVNDGSTDDTEAVLRDYPELRVISYTPNRGKTFALSQGISAATGDYVMLLDADLAGLTAADVQALAEPVISGHAQASISLRANSLPLYRWMGLDFISGERVIPKQLIGEALPAMEALPRWGGEAFINNLIIAAGLSLAVVDWPGVFNTPKTDKVGTWRGVGAELEMIGDAVGFLSPLGVVRQNLALLILASGDMDDAEETGPVETALAAGPEIAAPAISGDAIPEPPSPGPGPAR